MSPIRWLLWAGLAVVVLYGSSLVFPGLFYDDFQILSHAFTWADTRTGFWFPQNEHTMPLGRLTTWALVQSAPSISSLPFLCVLQGVVGLLLALPLVYLFVRRELDSPPLGLVAAFLFGLPTLYHQAVVWFAASFSVLALDTLLLGLLAAQSWLRSGRASDLTLCLLACFLAPGWFASGILAGPICCLYLMPGARSPARRWIPPLVPLLGPALFLALALPQVAEIILHLPHYQGRSAIEAFHPGVGLLYTARSLVDNLLLGQFGITGVCVPPVLVFPILVLMAWGLAVWLRPVRDYRLPLLGLGLIFLPYLLTYGARSTWSYVENGFYQYNWTRYHLFPQLGVALLAAAGLAPRCSTGDLAALSPGWDRALRWLLVSLFIVHAPRAILATPMVLMQARAFAHLAEVDARCRAEGISRSAAMEALPPLRTFPATPDDFNAWSLLRGSAAPREVPPEEIRRLLLVEGESPR